MANGRRYVYYQNQDRGRTEQLSTEHELQLGPPPAKIPRQFDENYRAIIDDGNYNFDNPMDQAYFPHTPIGKQMTAPTRQGVPAFSETAQVRSFSAGDNYYYMARPFTA
jgi:hypothetical protein